MRRRTAIGMAAALALSGVGGYGIAAAGEDERGSGARSAGVQAHEGMMAQGGQPGMGAGDMHEPMMGRAQMRRMHRSMLRDPDSRRMHGQAMKSPGMRAMHRQMHGRVR